MKITKDDLQIGDKFINTRGFVIEIAQILALSVKVKSKDWSNSNSTYNYDIDRVIRYINSGIYKNYKSIKSNNMNKGWKVGNIITCDSCSHSGKYSKDFEGEILSFYGDKGLNLKITKGTFINSSKRIREVGYILYNMTFNANNFKNLNNNNEKTREINTKQRRKKGGTAITSNSPRKVANASRLIGNAITNRIQTTKVGRFKISRNAISI